MERDAGDYRFFFRPTIARSSFIRRFAAAEPFTIQAGLDFADEMRRFLDADERAEPPFALDAVLRLLKPDLRG